MSPSIQGLKEKVSHLNSPSVWLKGGRGTYARTNAIRKTFWLDSPFNMPQLSMEDTASDIMKGFYN